MADPKEHGQIRILLALAIVGLVLLIAERVVTWSPGIQVPLAEQIGRIR